MYEEEKCKVKRMPYNKKITNVKTRSYYANK